MDDLIEALQIFSKYLDEKNDHTPTHCEHDVFMVVDIEEDALSEEDAKRLSELSFDWSDEWDAFCSYRFGSAY